MISYNRKSEMKSRNGIDCYVFNSPVPLFMKISGGQRLRFRGMYFQESFFRENNVSLYDSFWEDAKQSLTCNEIHSPELLSVYRRIENCPLAGDAFQLTEGKSIGEYIRALRMELALELLEKSDMSTGDIAKAVGYHGVSNFYHIFQQRFGETPQAVQYCFKTIRNSVIFIGCFHKLASNANIYMFCDFGRIAPAKMLVVDSPSPQDRPHSVAAARPADAEKF